MAGPLMKNLGTTDGVGNRSSWAALYDRQAYFCLSLHALLIITHSALLLVYSGHYEHVISFDTTKLSLTVYPLVVTTVMQILGTIYLALLVYYTQRLAFRSDLHLCQTLTAIHDKGNAWLGLGSAIVSFGHQFKLRAAMLGVGCTTGYLIGVWLLHITIPGLLSVVPYNATVPTVYPTLLANTSYDFNQASSYDILMVYDQVPTLGLLDNMVYDVIPTVPSAVGNTTVNASVYEVNCAALQDVPHPLTAFDTLPRHGQPNITWLEFQIGERDGLQANVFATLPYSSSAVYTGLISSVYSADEGVTTDWIPGSNWVPFVVLSTLPIIDSTGEQAPLSGGPWSLVDPQVIVPNETPAAMMTGVQLLACDVQVQSIIVEVAVNTREPVSNYASQTEILWKNWTWPADLSLTDQLRTAQSAPYFSPPSSHSGAVTLVSGSVNFTEASTPVPLPGFANEAFQVIPVDQNPIPNAILEVASTSTVIPTAFDIFLTEDLKAGQANVTNITLADVGRSLAKAVAATFWYGRNLNHSSAHVINKLVPPQYLLHKSYLNATSNATDSTRAQGEAVITVLVQRLRLNLSLIPIIIGLVASFALLVLSFLMIRVPSSAQTLFIHGADVTTGGVLQYSWLLGNEPHLVRVDSPELHELRAAGMFEVRMGDQLQKRYYSGRSSSSLDLDIDARYLYDDGVQKSFLSLE